MPLGYLCTFSLDELPPEKGKDQERWMRHLSISVVDPSNKQVVPHEGAVGELMKEFGFKVQFPPKSKEAWLHSKCSFYIESLSDGRKAINVAEEINHEAEATD